MKNKLYSILLIIIAVVISYYTAGYFGSKYSSLFGSGGAWIGSESSWNFIVGLPLSLVFFLTLTSFLLVFKSKKSVLWLISPMLLWEVTFDLRHIYLPIILGLIAFGLATLLQKLFKINSTQSLS